MKNAGTVLLYNCSGEKFSKLKQIFAMLRLRMRVVGPDRYHISLEELAQGKGEPGEAAQPLPESMLVFCGMGQEVIRVANLPPIPLKAVLTETNRQWNTIQLHEELCKEREAMAAQKEEKA